MGTAPNHLALIDSGKELQTIIDQNRGTKSRPAHTDLKAVTERIEVLNGDIADKTDEISDLDQQIDALLLRRSESASELHDLTVTRKLAMNYGAELGQHLKSAPPQPHTELQAPKPTPKRRTRKGAK